MAKLTVTEAVKAIGGEHLRFAPDGSRFVSIEGDKFHIWENRRAILTDRISTAHINRPYFTPNGEQLHIGMSVYDIGLKRFLERDNDTSTIIRTRVPLVTDATVWTPDLSQIVVYERFFPTQKMTEESYTGIRSRLIVKDGETHQNVAVLFESEDRSDYYTIEASDQVIVAGGFPAYVWQRGTYEQIAELYTHKTAIRDLRFYRDGSFLLSTDWDGHVVMWDAVTWSILANWVAHENGTYASDFHPRHPWVATCGNDNTVRLWNIANTPQMITELALDITPIDLIIHPEGERVVVALEGGGMVFCDIVD